MHSVTTLFRSRTFGVTLLQRRRGICTDMQRCVPILLYSYLPQCYVSSVPNPNVNYFPFAIFFTFFFFFKPLKHTSQKPIHGKQRIINIVRSLSSVYIYLCHTYHTKVVLYSICLLSSYIIDHCVITFTQLVQHRFKNILSAILEL